MYNELISTTYFQLIASFLFFLAHLWNKASIHLILVGPFGTTNWVDGEHLTGMADVVPSILSQPVHVLSHTRKVFFSFMSQLMIIRQFHSIF